MSNPIDDIDVAIKAIEKYTDGIRPRWIQMDPEGWERAKKERPEWMVEMEGKYCPPVPQEGF